MQSLNFLNQDDYRTYNLTIAKALKNINAAVFLTDLITRAIYFLSKGDAPYVNDDKEYWYYTQEKCEERTILSRKEQDTAIKKLQQVGLIEKKLFGLPAKRYFYVNEEAILNLFGLSKKHSSLTESDKLGCADETNCVVPLRQTRPIYKEPNKEPNNIAQTQSKIGHEQELYFCKDQKKFLGISDQDLSKWKTAYPLVDLKQQIAKAEEWILSNPSKSNKKQWRRFLTTWFSKNNDHIENKAAYQSSKYNNQPAQPNTQTPGPAKAPNIAVERLKKEKEWVDVITTTKAVTARLKIYDDHLILDNPQGNIKLNFLEPGFREQFKNALRKGGHL